MHTLELLEKHHGNGYIVLAEVRNGAGFNADRSCDYMVLSMWPSRGLTIEGYEEKASRTDWIKEYKEPAKAEAFYQYCDYWWLITHGEEIVKDGELPLTWGWKIIKNDKIVIKKQATKLTPKPIDKNIFIPMLKRAIDRTGWIKRSEVEPLIQAKEKQVEARFHLKNQDYRDNAIRNGLLIESLSKDLGIPLTNANLPKISKTLEAVQSGKWTMDSIRSILRQLKETSDLFSQAEKELKESMETVSVYK